MSPSDPGYRAAVIAMQQQLQSSGIDPAQAASIAGNAVANGQSTSDAMASATQMASQNAAQNVQGNEWAKQFAAAHGSTYDPSQGPMSVVAGGTAARNNPIISQGGTAPPTGAATPPAQTTQPFAPRSGGGDPRVIAAQLMGRSSNPLVQGVGNGIGLANMIQGGPLQQGNNQWQMPNNTFQWNGGQMGNAGPNQNFQGGPMTDPAGGVIQGGMPMQGGKAGGPSGKGGGMQSSGGKGGAGAGAGAGNTLMQAY